MAYGTITFFSEVLGQDMDVDYLIPDVRRRKRTWDDIDWSINKLPVIWTLHGNGDSHNAWIRKSNIELYARQFDVAVFMPACTREFYTDSKRGLKYFTYVADELPKVMRKYFPVSDRKQDNFVMGNSMGGYGATKLLLTYPECYGAGASFSGSVDLKAHMEDLYPNSDMKDNILHIFGSKEEYINSVNDNYYLLEQLKNKNLDSKIRYYQCCGEEDHLIEKNEEFHKVIVEKYADYFETIYSKGHGGHDWFYWNPQIENVFRFFGFDIDNCWNDSGIVRK